MIALLLINKGVFAAHIFASRVTVQMLSLSCSWDAGR